MSAGPRPETVPNGVQSLLRANQEAAARLPEPGAVYQYRDLDPELQDAFRKFHANDVILRADGPGPAPRKEMTRYRTDANAYHHAQRYHTGRSTLPCGHGGIRNLGDGQFACAEDSCSQTFDRDTAEAYLEA